MARRHFVFVGCLLIALLVVCPAIAVAQTALPDDARTVLRQTITQLQGLADQYQRNGQAAQANAIVDQIGRLQQTLSQSLPFVRMTGYRSRAGETFRVRVTGSDAPGRGIWGTDTYTDDSDLSLVVVHAGLLRPDQEGEVLITFLPGQSQYQGSTRNGVISKDFNVFPGSYRVARTDTTSASLPVLPAPSPQTPPSISVPAALVVINGLFSAANFNFVSDEQSLWQLLGGQPSAGRPDSPPLMGLRNHIGESFEFEVTGTASGAIWGDGIYTDDTDLGVAAVHAGALRVGERGIVRVTLLPGRSRYEGTTRNDVVSTQYNNWESSYRVEIPSSRPPLPSVTSLASISGRILDTSRRGLRGITVTVSGPRTYVVKTNADGEYLISGVLPGNYLVMAAGTPPSQSAAPAPIYFPAGMNRDTASQIPVQSGQQVAGIDLVLNAPRLFRVSGKVLNPPAGGVRSISVIPRALSAGPPSVAVLLNNLSPNGASGEFELMLPAGAWDVFPLAPTPRQNSYFVPPEGTAAYSTGRVAVDVIDRNVEGLMATFGSATIPGRIVVDSQVRLPAGFSLAGIEVRVSAVDGTPAPLWFQSRVVKVKDDGTFSLKALPQGSYRLQFSPAIPGISFSDAGVIRSGGAAGNPAEITVNVRASQ